MAIFIIIKSRRKSYKGSQFLVRYESAEQLNIGCKFKVFDNNHPIEVTVEGVSVENEIHAIDVDFTIPWDDFSVGLLVDTAHSRPRYPLPLEGDHTQTKPHVLADVQFFSTENGGRKGPTPATFLGCPAKIGDQYYDCRIFFDGRPMLPGESRSRLSISFLSPMTVRTLVKPGATIILWEGRDIGTAKVVEVPPE